MKKKKIDNSNMIRKSTRRWAPLFLWPTFAAFCIGFVWPFAQGLFLSFTKFKTTSKWTWVGLQNYVKAFADESFRYSFGYTAVYAIVSLVLINLLAFLIAYALTQKIRGANLFRTVFFMPNLIGGIVLGYIWSMIFDGILSSYGKSILTDSTWGFWGLIILMCWQHRRIAGRSGGYAGGCPHRRCQRLADPDQGHHSQRHALHHYLYVPVPDQRLQAL